MQVPCWEDGHFGHGDLLASGITFRPAPSQRPRTRSSVDEHPISLEKAKELLAGDACPGLSSSIRTTRTTRTCHQLSGSWRSTQAQLTIVESSTSLLLLKRQMRTHHIPHTNPALQG